MVGAIGLFEADRSILGRPVQRKVDMWGEFQIGQFSTLGDCLDDFRREKRQRDQAGDVAISYALTASDRGQQSRPDRGEVPRTTDGPARSPSADQHQACARLPSLRFQLLQRPEDRRPLGALLQAGFRPRPFQWRRPRLAPCVVERGIATPEFGQDRVPEEAERNRSAIARPRPEAGQGCGYLGQSYGSAPRLLYWSSGRTS
jgi:hypothetical protein